MKINHNQNENIQRYIELDGQQIPVTEEVYRAYKRPAWAEHKRKERIKRCRDENGTRCTRNCRECPKLRDGGDLSLEKFSDEGFDIADPFDMAEFVSDKLLFEELAAAIDELEPSDRAVIIARYQDERTVRDYAAEIGKSHQAVSKQEKRAIEKLRNLMGADGDK